MAKNYKSKKSVKSSLLKKHVCQKLKCIFVKIKMCQNVKITKNWNAWKFKINWNWNEVKK